MYQKALNNRRLHRHLELLILLLIMSMVNGFAQKKIITGFDIENIDGLRLCKGWIQNNDVLAINGLYTFCVIRNGKKVEKQSGFRAAPKHKTFLNKAIILLQPSDEVTLMKLEIRQRGKIIAVDSITTLRAPKEELAGTEEEIDTRITSHVNPSVKQLQDQGQSFKDLSSVSPKSSKPTENKNKLPPIKEAAPTASNRLPPPTFNELEIDGLIIDETRSKMAHDFYELFYYAWSPPSNAKDFLITIRELPSRGRSARISIEVNNQALIQRVLQPRSDLLELLAQQVVQALQNHLGKMEALKQELDSDDMRGSGIF